MKSVLPAPDSFKGTLTAEEICGIESTVIRRHVPDAVIRCVSMAGGG
ncbi:MAG: glycerate kinase [Oscillibacter sp.]|jgi:glycerate kinase|nr:glycerate kinase [Oscillibacter sp.]MCI9577799.1 glycerate kinase [Oscillibacter sp.]